MKEENNNNILIRNIALAVCAVVILGIGGCTCAHVNGIETIISPILKRIGLDNENSTKEVNKENVTIKLLDGAIEDNLLILGYEIKIPEVSSNSWIELEEKCKINDLSVYPINITMNKISDGNYIYYQMYDVKESENFDKVKVNVNIQKIKEFKEVENIDSIFAEYVNLFDAGWEFEEEIAVKNLKDSKVSEIVNDDEYIIKDTIKVEPTEFITGTYSNILKIKIDATNNTDNSFEKLYKVFDENGKEIAIFAEEENDFEEKIYIDRLVLGNIEKDSNLYVQVYFRTIQNKFTKVLEFPVDLSKTNEKVEEAENLEEHESETNI